MTAIAATGFAAGERTTPDLAAEAVRRALAAAGSDYAHGLLLFLTTPFARHVQDAREAVTAASRAARCLQVSGCTTPGVFTESHWALHQPAAAALALCGPVSLGPVRDGEPVLTLAQGGSIDAEWLIPYPPRYGILASGQDERDGLLWGQGKLREGRLDACFHGGSARTALSRGLRILSAPLTVTRQDGLEVLRLSNNPALDTLLLQLPPEASGHDTLPVQRLCALVLEPGMPSHLALRDGRYTLLPLLGVNHSDRSVSLPAPLPPDTSLLWAWREPGAAEQDSAEALAQLSDGRQAEPDFAVVFSCMGRGPYFFQGQDRDLALLGARHPRLPVIGAYGGGEIASLGDGNVLLSYSTVFTLVSADVQS